jgi:hypothetical protein
MKQFTESELENVMQTEFQRGFEACRVAAIKACRDKLPWKEFPDTQYREKTATECANEIARFRVP